MFAHPQPVGGAQNGSAKPVLAVPGVLQYPTLCVKGVRVVRLSHVYVDEILIYAQFLTACIVFGPLLWTELRWWTAAEASRGQLLIMSLVPLLLLLGAVNYGIPGLGLLAVQ